MLNRHNPLYNLYLHANQNKNKSMKKLTVDEELQDNEEEVFGQIHSSLDQSITYHGLQCTVHAADESLNSIWTAIRCSGLMC
jgi:hypothetical protein